MADPARDTALSELVARVRGLTGGPKMAMLRRLEARELVTCSKHGVWRITEAGKAALSARGER